MSSDRGEATRLLIAWHAGDEVALEQLLPLIYRELRELARGQMSRERTDHTLQATALVHEAYIRLIDQAHQNWTNRAHFLAVAARVMRRILVDHARARCARKRGGPEGREPLDEFPGPMAGDPLEILSIDDALTRLAGIDPRKARIIELRFFAGLSVQETASVIGLSVPTIVNETRMARAWLHANLS